jgi:hypothetical protein
MPLHRQHTQVHLHSACIPVSLQPTAIDDKLIVGVIAVLCRGYNTLLSVDTTSKHPVCPSSRRHTALAFPDIGRCIVYLATSTPMPGSLLRQARGGSRARTVILSLVLVVLAAAVARGDRDLHLPCDRFCLWPNLRCPSSNDVCTRADRHCAGAEHARISLQLRACEQRSGQVSSPLSGTASGVGFARLKGHTRLGMLPLCVM